MNPISHSRGLTALPDDIVNLVLSKLSTHFIGKTITLVSKDFRERSTYFVDAHFLDHRISACINQCRQGQAHESWNDLFAAAIGLSIPVPMIVSRMRWMAQSIPVLPQIERASARSALLKSPQVSADIVATVVNAKLNEYLGQVQAAGRTGTVETLTTVLKREFDFGVPHQALAVLRWLIKTSDEWEKENMQLTYFLFNKPEFMDVMCEAVAWTTMAGSPDECAKLLQQLCQQFDKRADDLLFEFAAQDTSEKSDKLVSQKQNFADAVAMHIPTVPADKRLPILLMLPEQSPNSMRALSELLSTPDAVNDEKFLDQLTRLYIVFRYQSATLQTDVVTAFARRIRQLGSEARKEAYDSLLKYPHWADEANHHHYWSTLRKELPDLAITWIDAVDATVPGTETTGS